MGSATARGSFFTEDDDDEEEEAHHMEADFSGNASISLGQSLRLYHHHSPNSSEPSMGSLRNRNIPYMASPVNSPGSGRFFYDPRCEENYHRAHYFLDSCALCQKPLGSHRDIFMYRGDTAFCSEECRQEQMEMDEASEKNRSLSSLRKDQRKKSTTSPSKSDGRRHLRTGTVAAG